MTNPLKEKLRRGEISIGTWSSISHPDVAEILSQCGYDWIMFDMEDGPLSASDLQHAMQAMDRRTTAIPIPRVARNESLLIAQALDAGAAGIAVPLVQNRAEAERAVSCALYPPKGTRGIGPRRVTRYGRDFADYLAKSNDHTFIAVMIESPGAVERADEIASVSGVDCVLIGTGDLSASMGCFHERSRPDFVAALDKVVAACRKHKVAPGIGYVGSAAKAKAFIDQGFQMIGLGEDVDHLTRGAESILAELKGKL